MEDIEDLVVGAGGAPPGFRLPLSSVGLKPKKKNNNPTKPNAKLSQIPGIQVSLSLSLSSYLSCFVFLKCFYFFADNIYQDLWVLTQPGLFFGPTCSIA